MFFRSFIVALTLLSSSAFSMSLKELSGFYLVTFEHVFTIVYTVSMSKKGAVKMTEYVLTGPETGEFRKVECEGRANIVDGNLLSEVECANGKKFTQLVYEIHKIRATDSFEVKISSSLFGDDVVMDARFERKPKDFKLEDLYTEE